jgi:hypothetical protein
VALNKFRTLLFLLTFLVAVVHSARSNTNEKPAANVRAGTVEKINLTERTLSVRTGDATTTYSFDNKTFFTYGDRQIKPSHLRLGSEVFVKSNRGKAAEVNGTEHVVGVIDQIDTKGKKLIFKIGDQLREIEFKYFRVMRSDGRMLTLDDLSVGNEVLLDLNIAFWKPAREKKP